MFYQILKDGRPILINLDHVTAIGPATSSTEPDKPYAVWIGRDPFREPESAGLTEGQHLEVLRLVGHGRPRGTTSSVAPVDGSADADLGRLLDEQSRAFVEGAVADAMSDAPLDRSGRADLPYWLRGEPQDES